MRARGRALAVCLLAVLVAAPTGIAASAQTTSLSASGPSPTDPAESPISVDAATSPTAVGADALAVTRQEQPDENESTNGTTVQHRDPDVVSEAGNLDAVKGWLSGQMARSLRESSLQISQGQYEAGKRALGDEYTELLGQYVDVAGETDTASDDDTAETLNATQETQEAFANTTQEYEATYEAYEQAKANGNDARARELARELARLGEQIRTYNRQLDRNYTRLGNQTDQDFSTVTERFQNVTDNVTERALTVQERELVRTELDLSPVRGEISFTDPLVLTGRLRVLANASMPEELRLVVAGQARTVDVGQNGSFELRYRPRTMTVGEQRFDVAYVPDPESLYLGAKASVNATVSAVTPRVTVEDPPAAGYGDRVSIAGRVAVNGTSVGGVPVVVTVAGRALATVRTGSNGQYRTAPRLPAGIPAGDVDVQVRAGVDGQAIAANETATELVVERTPTTLSINATAAGDGVGR